VDASIFNNIKNEEGITPLILLCLFLLIFCCNIPFVFFAGKLAFMAVIHQSCFSKNDEEQLNEDEEFFNADTAEAPTASQSESSP